MVSDDRVGADEQRESGDDNSYLGPHRTNLHGNFHGTE
jgi:hypothetical protein